MKISNRMCCPSERKIPFLMKMMNLANIMRILLNIIASIINLKKNLKKRKMTIRIKPLITPMQ